MHNTHAVQRLIEDNIHACFRMKLILQIVEHKAAGEIEIKICPSFK